ncbi:hypothetical protein ACJJIK_10860 [Microbulbifer sp. ZKSA006]|uniref:hypothetical protein n=1 Tax=Microbulbifer sp. ZKSA006 TaxID=3243390 RepID=UPI0040394BAF
MKLIFEYIYPYLLGVIGSALWYLFALKFPADKGLLSSTLSVAGIFVGFLATSKAILISMDSPIIQRLRESGYINELVSYISQAVWLNLSFCGAGVIGFFIKEPNSWFAVVWIGVGVAAFFAFIRVTDVMLKIFRESHGTKKL